MTRLAVGLGGTGLFVVFALVQLNDPDPALWVIAYLIPAIASAVAAFQGLPRILSGGGAVAAFGTAAWVWAAWDGTPHVMGPASQGMFAEEVVREVTGLAIVGLWFAVLAAAFPADPDPPRGGAPGPVGPSGRDDSGDPAG